MTSASAEAAKLKAIMARHGVMCSIELQIGRPWAGDDWYSAKHVLVNHHTAGATTGNTPSLALVKKGRGADLPGPLCNGYGGRDHIYRIITMGLANHPGAGGPLTVAGFSIPKDSARISTWGTEWEHDGVSAWPADMQEFMGRANAALCEFWGISASRSIEHSTWAPRRKIDRNRYTAATGQAEIRLWQPAGASVPVKPAAPTKPQEDDMAEWLASPHKLSETDAKAYGGTTKAGDTRSGSELLRYPPATAKLRRELTAQIGALTGTVSALAEAINTGAAVTPDQVKAWSKAGAQEALAELGHDLLDNDDNGALPGAEK